MWAHPAKDSYILNKSIHIWKINYPDFSGKQKILLEILNNTEKERSDKFHFKTDRKRYITTKALLKIILAQTLSTEPGQINFEFNKYGKPLIKNSNSPHFNVSHSADIGIIAITDVASIGVDVEKYRKRMNSPKVAKRFFSEKEAKAFLSLPHEQRLQGFFNCWTRKEAFIKALGLGLAMPLRDFDVTLKPGEETILEHVIRNGEHAEDWTLKNIPLENDYAAAFAVKAKIFRDYYWSAGNLI